MSRVGEVVSELGKMLHAFNRALDEVTRHPLKALREWWEDATRPDDYPPRRYTGKRRP